MCDATREEDPLQVFGAAILVRMAAGNIGTKTLSEQTQIPEGRLLAIINGMPGSALFSDLIALARFFDVSVDSFFR